MIHFSIKRMAVIVGLLSFIGFFGIHGADVARANPVGSLSDITYWVGQGQNEAALVIDWDGHSTLDNALVWGFRWDGEATGADLFNAVLRADDRLYGKLGSFGSQVAVYGIGHDTSGDGSFVLDDGTQFDTAGSALSAPADLGASMDVADWYQEGWFLGYWYHAVASGAGGGAPSWVAGPGLSARNLSDGDWDSLAYKDVINFNLTTPSQLVAAEDTSLVGDFNRNGHIDAADFTLWRNTLGQTPLLPGYGADGNFNGLIDAGDLDVWKNAFQDQSPPSIGNTLLVPEPAAIGILAWMFLILIYGFRKNF